MLNMIIMRLCPKTFGFDKFGFFFLLCAFRYNVYRANIHLYPGASLLNVLYCFLISSDCLAILMAFSRSKPFFHLHTFR